MSFLHGVPSRFARLRTAWIVLGVCVGLVTVGPAPTPVAAQSIASLQPESGAPGTQVRVYGDGFSTTASENTVTFGSATASVDSAKTNVLYVTVPSGVRGLVEVEVTTGGTTVTAADRFAAVTTGSTLFTDMTAGLAGVSDVSSVDWGDYDGDGDLDVVVAGQNTDATVYRNDGSGTFVDVEADIFAGGPVAWGDYDGDGDLDLAVPSDQEIYENTEFGFDEVAGFNETTLADLSEASSVDWGDYDGDGDLDLVVTGTDPFEGKTSKIYENDGGSFSSIGADLLNVSNGASKWGDFDGDGDLDLVLTGLDRNDVPVTRIYENEGGSFSPISPNPTGVTQSSADWGDYDGDGDLDLVVTGEDSDGNKTATIYENQGGGSFSSLGTSLTGVFQGSAEWGDVDGDGDLDLILTGQDENSPRSTTIYENQGSGTFAPLDAGLAGVSQSDASWGDFDGDGALDLVVAGSGSAGAQATVYRSEGGSIAPLSPSIAGTSTEVAGPGATVQVSWTSVPSGDLDGYRIYRDTAPIDSAAGPSGLTPLNSSLLTDTAYTDTEVSVGQTYYYRVTAVDTADNESGFSGEREVQPIRRITSVRPATGAPGSAVRIHGIGFDSTTTGNTVTFGSAGATVDSVKANMLYTQVPSGTSEGSVPLSVAVGDTTLTAPGGFGVATDGGPLFSAVDADLMGVRAGSVEWGDFNQDGRPDFVITDEESDGSGNLAIYRNVGGGRFERVFAGLPNYSQATADWGDYDGDGDLDLALAGVLNFEDEAQIFENEGDGTFTPIGADLSGGNFSTLAWGDYNADGRLDLFVSGSGSSAVYRNEGNDTFTSVSPFRADVSSADWGDYTNDGLLDALLGDQLFRNEGGGAFTEVIDDRDRDLGFGNRSAWGDYNQDGRLDIAIVGSREGRIYRNEGDGTFTRVNAGITGVQEGDVAWGDVDGDGDPDLVVVGDDNGFTDGGYSATVYRNEGGGTFTAHDTGLTGVINASADWGDFNNDGALDLVITGEDSTSTATTVVYRNEGGSIPPQPPSALAASATATASSAQATLRWNASGAPDLDGYQVYRATAPIDSSAGPSSLTPINSSLVQDTAFTDDGLSLGTTYHYRVTAVDTADNESGLSAEQSVTPQQRVASFTPSSGAPGTTVRIYGSGFSTTPDNNTVTFGSTQATVDSARGRALYVQVPSGMSGTVDVSVSVNGTALPVAEPFEVVTSGSAAFLAEQAGLTDVRNGALDWGDYDSDGNRDLVVVGQTGERTPTTTIYRNDGDGTFTAISAGLPDVQRGTVAWGDYNGDGRPDLFVSGFSGETEEVVATLFRNDGGGTFTSVETPSFPDRAQTAADWGDYDGDGDLDLILEDTIYRNEGGGSFARAGTVDLSVESAAWGDYNGDGALDLAVSGFGGTAVYRNTGSGAFTKLDRELPEATAVAWADYNGDGALDLAVFGAQTTALYRNDGGGSFTELQAGLTLASSAVPAWGDIDGDGAPDLAYTGSDSTRVYRNDGDDVFTNAGVDLPGLSGSPSIAWADYDGDGQLDLALMGRIGDAGVVTALYRNVEEGLSATASASVSSDGTTSFGDTGTELNFSGVSSGGEVTVDRYTEAPSNPDGISESNVSQYRVTIEASGLDFSSAQIQLAVSAFSGIDDPTEVTIYKRTTEGAGAFDSLETTVGNNDTPSDIADDTLYASTDSFSEFVLASDSQPLPVELAGFDATVDDEEVTLSWQTASETGNAGFRIQRKSLTSTDDVKPSRRDGSEKKDGAWTTIGAVEGSGTTSQAQSYRFTDGDLPYEADALTYRLKQVDADGSANYSKTITVERGVDEVQLLGSFPNPAQQRATVRYALPDRRDVEVRLYDVLGRRVRTVVRGAKEGRHEQTLDVRGLSSGVYFLRLEAGGEVRTQKLTVAR